jgi:hypothetical protein
VTLTGPGGVGKTRLALAAASAAAADFADGVVVVPLAAVSDPALVLPAIASALGVREVLGRPLVAALAVALRDRHLLLVLDNVEHVAAAAPDLSALRASCPGLRILASSRSALRLAGEGRFPVPPLGLPAEDDPVTAETLDRYPAPALFVQRARAARPDFAVDDPGAAPSPRSAAGSTGCPWRSSWPRPGSGRCRSTNCSGGWSPGSPCSAAAPSTSRSGCGRCAPRSPGRTTCSRRRRPGSSGACRCSPAGFPFGPRNESGRPRQRATAVVPVPSTRSSS